MEYELPVAGHRNLFERILREKNVGEEKQGVLYIYLVGYYILCPDFARAWVLC